MNKTVTCNIAGLVFHIEEQAYENLLNYINAVKKRLSNSSDADEIIQDVEARIAELFSNSISNRQEVILDKNVSEVIAALGKPEDFVIDDEFESEKKSEEETFSGFSNARGDKTLMRDTENGVIAGVCAGIAAYIGWDVVWVRILFLIALFLPGFGFIVYIVLWIAAPVAQTSADRLRMQGKPVNIDTITQEVEEAAARLERYANAPKTKKKIEKMKKKGSEFGSFFRRFFGALLFIGGLLGIFFFLFVGLVENGFFIHHDGESAVSLYHFSSIIFNSNYQAIAGWSGLLALVLLPLFFLTIAGVFLIFNVRGKALGRIFMTFLGFWIAGVIIFSLVSAQIARDFSFRESVEKELFQAQFPRLQVEIPELDMLGSGFKLSDDDIDFRSLHLSNETVSFGYVQIEVTDSKDSLFHVSSTHYASGISRRRAYSRIDNISHQVTLDSNLLRIAPTFEFPLKDRLRYQKVVVEIAIPKDAHLEWIGNKRRMYEIRDFREGQD